MRLRIAAIALPCLLASVLSAAPNEIYVLPTNDGAVIRVPGVRLEDCELVPSVAPRYVLAIDGATLTSRILPNRSSWLRTIRVVGSDVLRDESRIVVEASSSLLEPRLEKAWDGVSLVLSSRSEPAPAPSAPPAAAAPDDESEARPEPPRREPERRAQRRHDEENERPEREAEPRGTGQPWRNDVPGMIVVPGGDVVIGSLEGTSFPDESPPHVARLHSFRIDSHEVTVDEFSHSPVPMPRQPEWSDDPGDPVVNVTWNEAEQYCDWAGKRLPTETEWERAARGTDRRIHPWGSEWNVALANSGLDGDGASHLSPVGSYPDGASPEGALDMAGNAWEWTSDWYDERAYSHAAFFGPDGPSRGSHKVARGGSFRAMFSTSVTTTVRFPLPPSARRDDVGFRCASSN